MTRKSSPPTQRTAANENTPTGQNPSIDSPGVHTVTGDEYESSTEIVNELHHQETRSPLDEANCCASGDQGFRIYKTDLPKINTTDLQPGLLIYRPTTSPLTVYELVSEPYENEHGSHRVDVLAHSRTHAGADPEIVTREQSLFVTSVIDEMTFLQPSTVQQTLTGIPA